METESSTTDSFFQIYSDFEKFPFLRPCKKHLAKRLQILRDKKLKKLINSEEFNDNVPEEKSSFENLSNQINEAVKYESEHKIGDEVIVDSRTFPGMNKPGGVGKIVKVNYRNIEEDYVYSVKYFVESGTEHNVEEVYIHSHEFRENDIINRRNKIFGRCRQCNSFVIDCTCKRIPLQGAITTVLKGMLFHSNINSNVSLLLFV